MPGVKGYQCEESLICTPSTTAIYVYSHNTREKTLK
jgi:hypothetical protein